MNTLLSIFVNVILVLFVILVGALWVRWIGKHYRD